MAASNAIKAIGTLLRIQSKRKSKKKKLNCRETKEFLPLSFDRFIFICSNIITSKTFLVELEFYALINFNVRLNMPLNCFWYYFVILLNLIESLRKTFLYLFVQSICFIRMFSAWSFVSINDVSKLVSSISSALNYLVRKLH